MFIFFSGGPVPGAGGPGPGSGEDRGSVVNGVSAASAGSMATVVCASGADERRHCPADTSAGVLLTRETGEMACLLGRSWGYDSAGVWVMDGCSGEFLVAGTPPEPETATDVATVAASSEAGEGGPDVPRARQTPTSKRRHPQPVLGSLRSRQGISHRQGKGRGAVDQRLRAGAVHEPDAGGSDLHRPPRQRAPRRRPAGHLLRTGSWSG